MPKKLSILICCMLMIMTLGTEVFAASAPVVYADKVTVSGSEDIKVPVYIKNNTGLSGFHFQLKYDPEKVTVTNVSNAQLTSSGLFNQNLGLKDGKFDVVWAGAEAMTGQGPIFTIYIRAGKLEDETSIKMTYVEDDTFDGDMNNVAVSCKSIKISKDASADPAKAGQGEVEGNPEEPFLAKEIREEVTSQLDQEEAIAIIYKRVKEEGVENIRDLTPAQAKKVMDDILAEMKAKGMSTDAIEDMIKKSEEEGLDTGSILQHAVFGIYKDSKEMAENADQSFPVEPVGSDKPVAAIAAVVLILAALAAAIIFFFRKKKEGAGR